MIENFSEKSHEKAPPVELMVQSSVLLTLQKGADVQTPEDFHSLQTETKSDIKFFRVSKEDIKRFDEVVPEVVPPVKGTFGDAPAHLH